MSDQLPTHATGVLEIFSTSRTGINIFSDQIIESVQAGEISPLKVRIWIKTMEEILERVKKETAQNQLTEADKWSEKKFEYMGATIEKAPVSTSYDFTVCKDAVWERFKADEDTAATRKKEREAILKALTGPMDVISEDGEAVKIYPPLKKQVDGLKISIK